MNENVLYQYGEGIQCCFLLSYMDEAVLWHCILPWNAFGGIDLINRMRSAVRRPFLFLDATH